MIDAALARGTVTLVASACLIVGCAPTDRDSGPRTRTTASTTAAGQTSSEPRPAEGARLCGTVPGIRDEGPLPVRVTRGDIACPTAIVLANTYFRQSATTQGHSNSYIEVEGCVCESAIGRSPVPDRPYYECLSPPLSAVPSAIVTIGPR